MPKCLRKSNKHQTVTLFERSYDTVFDNVVILNVSISRKEREKIEKHYIPF